MNLCYNLEKVPLGQILPGTLFHSIVSRMYHRQARICAVAHWSVLEHFSGPSTAIKIVSASPDPEGMYML